MFWHEPESGWAWGPSSLCSGVPPSFPILQGSRSRAQAVWRKHSAHIFTVSWIFLKISHQQLPTLNKIFSTKMSWFSVLKNKADHRNSFIKFLSQQPPSINQHWDSAPSSSSVHWHPPGEEGAPSYIAPAWLGSASRKAAVELLALILLFGMLFRTARHDTPCLRGSSDFFSSQMKTGN